MRAGGATSEESGGRTEKQTRRGATDAVRLTKLQTSLHSTKRKKCARTEGETRATRRRAIHELRTAEEVEHDERLEIIDFPGIYGPLFSLQKTLSCLSDEDSYEVWQTTAVSNRQVSRVQQPLSALEISLSSIDCRSIEQKYILSFRYIIEIAECFVHSKHEYFGNT